MAEIADNEYVETDSTVSTIIVYPKYLRDDCGLSAFEITQLNVLNAFSAYDVAFVAHSITYPETIQLLSTPLYGAIWDYEGHITFLDDIDDSVANAVLHEMVEVTYFFELKENSTSSNGVC